MPLAGGEKLSSPSCTSRALRGRRLLFVPREETSKLQETGGEWLVVGGLDGDGLGNVQTDRRILVAVACEVLYPYGAFSACLHAGLGQRQHKMQVSKSQAAGGDEEDSDLDTRLHTDKPSAFQQTCLPRYDVVRAAVHTRCSRESWLVNCRSLEL